MTTRADFLTDVPGVTRNTEGRETSLFRYSPRDAWLAGLAVLQAGVFALGFARVVDTMWGSVAFALSFGVMLCWSSNTISHNHLHKPLFRARAHNRALSLWLTLSMGVPQSIWRARHFWHHAGEPSHLRPRIATREAAFEIACIGLLWGSLCWFSWRGFVFAYLPGYVFGMALCQLQGKMEHELSGTPLEGVSYYGKLYNFLWFNDGFHAEHHRFPTEHWTRLPLRSSELLVHRSALPPLVRFVEPRVQGLFQGRVLGLLERLALGSRLVQRFMLATHERAFSALIALAGLTDVRRVAIIGGGLFPRTALVLRRLLPQAELTIIDHSRESVDIAQKFFDARGLDRSALQFRIQEFAPEQAAEFDLVVAPLAFVGDSSLLRRTCPKRGVVLHEWLWRASDEATVRISWLLWKRLTLLQSTRPNS